MGSAYHRVRSGGIGGSDPVQAGSGSVSASAGVKRSRMAAPISWWRRRKERSSSFLRRSQPVASSLHLLALHDRQAGAMLSKIGSASGRERVCQYLLMSVVAVSLQKKIIK